MKSNEPINLISFRSEAFRQHSRVVERQYRLSLILVVVLFAATAAAFLTFRATDVGMNGRDQTAKSTAMNVARG